jgi:putative endonuclease
MNVMYYLTYVLKSQKDGKLYTGYTRQLRKRLDEHNLGLNRSTKGRGPFTLIYFEGCLSKDAAMKREQQLKSGHGKRYLKIIKALPISDGVDRGEDI